MKNEGLLSLTEGLLLYHIKEAMKASKLIGSGLLLGIMLMLVAQACKEESSVEPVKMKINNWGVMDVEDDLPIPDWMDKDSLIRQWTDTLVSTMRTDEGENRTRYVIFPNTFAETDSIAYTVVNNQITSIIARHTKPAHELFLEYYYSEGDLRYARQREWTQRPENCGAREINFFLKNKNIFYVRERKTVLDFGEPPARIGFYSLQPSQRPKQELIDDLNAYLPLVTDIVEKDYQMRTAQ